MSSSESVSSKESVSSIESVSNSVLSQLFSDSCQLHDSYYSFPDSNTSEPDFEGFNFEELHNVLDRNSSTNFQHMGHSSVTCVTGGD